MGKFEVLNLIKELLGGFFSLIRFSIRKGELGNYVTGLKILRCFRGSFWKRSSFWIFVFFCRMFLQVDDQVRSKMIPITGEIVYQKSSSLNTSFNSRNFI